jgi:hypothetical protein
MEESPELTLLRQYAEETEREEEFENLLKKIEENFRTDLQQSINHTQNEDMSVFGSKGPNSDISGKKTTRYDEQTELKTAEMLSEYLVDRFNKVQTDTGEINISKTNINKINTDVMQDEINSSMVYEMRNTASETNRLSEDVLTEKNLAEKTLTEQTFTEKILSEKMLNEEIFTNDSWLTYMKNYAEQTEQEKQLRTLLQKIEDKLEKDIQTEEIRRTLEKGTQTGEIQHTLGKDMPENRKYRSDEPAYNTESLKTEILYLLENSEISKSFINHFENTEEAFLTTSAKNEHFITENEVTLTQITRLLEYRTDIRTDMQGYLRQSRMSYADDIKNSRYRSLLQENLSYRYVNSSEEYFENSRSTGEIQYALQSVDSEKANNERVEKLLGDVKQKLEQVTRNVNTLNSAQNNMKEEFVRKKDIVSFRKELLNHLEEDISTAGKRQGILH